jgi:predicted aspartyl protease
MLSMKMKFELGKGSGHPQVPVFVNGKGPYIFTLDTGAVTTTLSTSLARELGIETYEGDKAKATGVGGGRVPVEFARVNTLQLGEETVENEEVLVIDLGSALGGCFTAGVIGHSTLKNYRLHVDYPHTTMSLDRDGMNLREQLNPDWTDFEYIGDTHLVTVEATLDEKGPFHLVVDTGSGGTVITPNTAERLGLSRDQAVAAVKVGSVLSDGCGDGCQGIGGSVSGYAVQVKEIKAGGVVQENAVLAVIDLSIVSPRGSIISDGIIGYPFMKDLELIIDYPKKKIAFVRVAPAN